MLKPITLTLFVGFLSLATFGQDEATITERRIEIEDGQHPKVTITTSENGKTTIEELYGKAAEKYIQDRETAREEEPQPKRTIVEINIDEEDVEAMKASMQKVRVELAEEMDRVAHELKEMDMDSIMESIGIEIERTIEDVRYRFDSEDENKTSVIVVRSKGNDDDTDVDVEVEVRTDNNTDAKEVRVSRTKMVVEDHSSTQEGKGNIRNLEVYPVPSDGAINVAFENKDGGPVRIEVKNMQGETLREMKIKRDGKKRMKMNLDDLPAGTYLIEVTEGSTAITKKLVIE